MVVRQEFVSVGVTPTGMSEEVDSAVGNAPPVITRSSMQGIRQRVQPGELKTCMT